MTALQCTMCCSLEICPGWDMSLEAVCSSKHFMCLMLAASCHGCDTKRCLAGDHRAVHHQPVSGGSVLRFCMPQLGVHVVQGPTLELNTVITTRTVLMASNRLELPVREPEESGLAMLLPSREQNVRRSLLARKSPTHLSLMCLGGGYNCWTT